MFVPKVKTPSHYLIRWGREREMGYTGTWGGSKTLSAHILFYTIY